jgi:hypothetical protein
MMLSPVLMTLSLLVRLGRLFPASQNVPKGRPPGDASENKREAARPEFDPARRVIFLVAGNKAAGRRWGILVSQGDQGSGRQVRGLS